ncbi:hypothetical protein ABT301_07065 [Streptomyces sp. NPDC000987]|uniref:hypothetical protein n=1 Tax=Streptomyces sp. NPDC000987 TaxID=3154374 RepID=UPI00332C247F
MPTTSATTTIRSRYAEQAISDLAENRRRQKELTRQLEALHQEEALLLDILKLAGASDAVSDAASDLTPVPRQAQNEPEVSASVTSATSSDATEAATRRPRDAGASPDTRQRETHAGRTGAKAADKQEERPALLQDLLLELLAAHTEPRLAAELREELLSTHPDRQPTPQVVRNTLEALVAKGRIQRHKQNRSVMYTVVESDDT